MYRCIQKSSNFMISKPQRHCILQKSEHFVISTPQLHCILQKNELFIICPHPPHPPSSPHPPPVRFVKVTICQIVVDFHRFPWISMDFNCF